MSKSNVWENELLLLTFNNVAAAGIGDAGGLQPSAVAGSFYLALHTSDPGEAGGQSTNETAYTGYARVAVPRTSVGFVVTGDAVRLAADTDFGLCTGTPGQPITHFSVGDSSTGTGKIRYSGTLSPSITIAEGVIPRLTNTSLVTED